MLSGRQRENFERALTMDRQTERSKGVNRQAVARELIAVAKSIQGAFTGQPFSRKAGSGDVPMWWNVGEFLVPNGGGDLTPEQIKAGEDLLYSVYAETRIRNQVYRILEKALRSRDLAKHGLEIP